MKPPTLKLQGIAELRCWINHIAWRYPSGQDTEECLEAHHRAGLHRVAWELGRSVLAYHSRLPETTCWGRHDRPGELGERPEIEKMLGDRCSLRIAIKYARTHNMTIYGRLSMNRYYRPGFKRSRWADHHPGLMEIAKDGMVDPSRLCYASAEVRRERIAILLEAAEIGCDGLLLDFCRQPPFARFHSALVNPWYEEHGIDPRELNWSDNREAYLEWCAFRASFITGFMRELRAALDRNPRLPGKRYPVQVRFPNDGLEANLIAGLDIAGWCREGLIDELAPSELHWLEEYRDFNDAPYVELGGRYGLPVTTSVSFNVRQKSQSGLSRGHNPLVLARRVLDKWDPGISGIVFFQSDTGIQLPGFTELLPRFSSREGLETLLADPELRKQFPVREDEKDYGIDHHSFLRQFAADQGRIGNGA